MIDPAGAEKSLLQPAKRKRAEPLQPTGFAETDEKVSVDNDHCD